MLGLVSGFFLPEWLQAALFMATATLWFGWVGLLAAGGLVLLDRWGRDD